MILIPETSPPSEPDKPVGEARERLAKVVADVMFERRKGRTLMAWGASPERDEALAYVDAVLGALREPSQAMLHARHPEHSDGVDFFLDGWDARDVWQAMIGEILK